MSEKGNASRYFARIVRAVVVSSLGFGGGIGLLCFIAILVNTGKQSKSLAVALQAGIVLGIGFGVCYALLLLLSDLTWRLYAAKGLQDEIWELEQSRQVTVDGTLRDARSLSRKALLAVPNIKAVADEDDEHQIRGSVGPSWKSPGENMQIVISADGDNRWLVRCTSSCLAANIAFDYGKNFENVESWLRTIRRLQTEQPNEQEMPT